MGECTKRLEKLHNLQPSPTIYKIREIGSAYSTANIDDKYTFGQGA
jgi:hypothetical protein